MKKSFYIFETQHEPECEEVKTNKERGVGMREIKFRVFDKAHENTHIVGTDGHDSFNCFDNEVTYYNLQNGEGSGEHGDYILMQYTGLKDKNGREIYEGDILEVESEIYPFGKSGIGIVKFLDGSYLLENVQGDDGDYLFNDAREVEIIGNIYGNPELLEVAE